MIKFKYHFEELRQIRLKPAFEKIQAYSRLLSDIKSTFTPHQKNWEEYSLKIYAKGFTTTPIPVDINNRVEAMDLNLNFVEHKLKIFIGKERLSIDLDRHSAKSFSNELIKIFNEQGIDYKLPEEKFSNETNREYDLIYTQKYWDAVKQTYFVLQKFRGNLLEETSNINFWPHHMDLALLIFSGRIIPGKDPSDWDNSREQINFGFSPGDDGTAEPYFYITAYPFPENVFTKKLPDGSYWHQKGWKGAVMNYSALLNNNVPDESLSNFFNSVKKIVDEEREV